MKLKEVRNAARQKPFASTTLHVARGECSFAQENVNIRKPFLKWAGAKTKVSQLLRALMPTGDFRFVEPFVGSGAVFLNTPYNRGVLADANADVINLYRLLKKDGDAFIEECRDLFGTETNKESRFYELRTEFNSSRNLTRRASLFVYLNRHCFNGLCRFNQSGEFNTPFGRYERPYFPAVEMRRFAEKLETAELRVADFRETLALAGTDDVVYCDPPYVPISKNGFTQYSNSTFSPKDQQDLVTSAIGATKRGATVLISNHDTVVTRKLYENAAIIVPLLVSRTISCDGESRNKARELIAIFEPKNEHPRGTR